MINLNQKTSLIFDEYIKTFGSSFIRVIDNNKTDLSISNSNFSKEYRFEGIDLSQNHEDNLKKLFYSAKLTSEETSLLYLDDKYKSGFEFTNKFAYLDKNIRASASTWFRNNDCPDYFTVFYSNHWVGNDITNAEIVYTYSLKDTGLSDYIKSFLNRTDQEQVITKTDFSSTYKFNGFSIKMLSKNNFYSYNETEDLTIKENHENELLLYAQNKFLLNNLFNFEFYFKDINTDRKIENYRFYFYKEEESVLFDLDIYDINQKYDLDLKNTYSIDSHDSFLVSSLVNKNFRIENEIPETSNFIKDRKNNIYPIQRKDEKTFDILKKEIDLFNFLGVKFKSGRNYSGFPLNGPSRANLKISLEQSDRNVLFKNGDYFEIYSSVFSESNLKWRVVANSKNCCSSSEVCFEPDKKIYFRSYDIIQIDNHLEIITEGKILLNEGDMVTLTYHDRKYDCEIFDVNYDRKNNHCRFKIFDERLVTIFEPSVPMTFECFKAGYHYTFFDPKGNPSQVIKNIQKAIKLFTNIPILTILKNNSLLICNKSYGSKFKQLYLKFSFSKKTDISKVKINDLALKGINFQNNSPTKEYIYKYGKIKFYGDTDNTNKSIFVIRKSEITDLLNEFDSDDVITTKITKERINQFRIEDNIVHYSNYFSDNSLHEDYLSFFINTNKNDEITTLNNLLLINKKFKPSFLTLNQM